eukprot:jgi/Chlat1/5480/Chrsp36S05455
MGAPIARQAKADKHLSRNELLAWLNELLQTDYTKLTDLADGVAVCQVLDAVYPEQAVRLDRVNFSAKTSDAKLNNWRLVASALDRQGLSKQLNLAALSQGKLNDLQDILQWCYALCQQKQPLRSYNAFEKRMQAQTLQLSRLPAPKLRINVNLVPNSLDAVARVEQLQRQTPAKAPTPVSQSPSMLSIPTPRLTPAALSSSDAVPRVEHKLETLEMQLQCARELDGLADSLAAELHHRLHACLQLENDIATSDRERRFYFNKLRRIERVCDRAAAVVPTMPGVLDVMDIIGDTGRLGVDLSCLQQRAVPNGGT